MNLESVMQYMNVGGGFVVWALALCSVLVVGVCLERLYVFFRSDVDGRWLLKQVTAFVSHDKLEEAVAFCAGKQWLIARVFQIGLNRAHCAREEMLDAMSVAVSDCARMLEANLSILGTIAVVAPF